MVNAQLPLHIRFRDDSTFAGFEPGRNVEAVHYLQVGFTAGQSVYLWGGAGTGKTHLLEAVCRLAAGRGESAVYLPLRERADLAPALLEGLEALALVCVDDIGAIAGDAVWEAALFHLFNRVREGGGRIVIAGAASPRALGLGLPDLATRLSWGLVFQLQPLLDDEKAQALRLRARVRGMEMPEAVARYLLQRHARDMGALFELLERLDRASLAAQRRLTVPFVREVAGED
ncbi:MAG: DnaA regulatory inactivator Hda [Gammaproteobacteria bacterium]|nr:DnaA regulatory inactivator Hda [Gammaproteobacteria bacterium]